MQALDTSQPDNGANWTNGRTLEEPVT